MEFLTKSLLQTTTSITVSVNSSLAYNIMNRDITKQYITSNYNNDATTASMTITLDATSSVSKIALMGMNLKSFNIYYNGSTANSLTLLTADTTTANYTNNSDTAKFFSFTTISATTITIDMRSTISANSEKALGYLYVGDTKLDFETMPDAKGYKPNLDSKEIIHKMSDGGTRVNVVSKKLSVDVKLKYISETFRNNLKEVYDEEDDFAFVAFPTSTGWDQILFPCVWLGDFDFYNFSENSPGTGFDGTIRLAETSF